MPFFYTEIYSVSLHTYVNAYIWVLAQVSCSVPGCLPQQGVKFSLFGDSVCMFQ